MLSQHHTADRSRDSVPAALESKLSSMSPRKQAVLQLSHEYLMPHRVETWLKVGVPLVIGRREGYRLWDMDGKELMDFHLNKGTYNTGVLLVANFAKTLK